MTVFTHSPPPTLLVLHKFRINSRVLMNPWVLKPAQSGRAEQYACWAATLFTMSFRVSRSPPPESCAVKNVYWMEGSSSAHSHTNITTYEQGQTED